MNCQFYLKFRHINGFLKVFSFADHSEHNTFIFKSPNINTAAQDTIGIGLQMKANSNAIAKIVNLNNPDENPITTKKKFQEIHP